jgi:hypothetical protein
MPPHFNGGLCDPKFAAQGLKTSGGVVRKPVFLAEKILEQILRNVFETQVVSSEKSLDPSNPDQRLDLGGRENKGWTMILLARIALEQLPPTLAVSVHHRLIPSKLLRTILPEPGITLE